MANAENILISVHPRHVDNMVSGSKTVELRRRPLKVDVGCKVWIYCTLPRGRVEAVGTVARIVEASPSSVWRSYGRQSGLTKAEFDQYYDNSPTAYVIVFASIRKLPAALGLDEIRRHLATFQPPQFFKRLLIGGPELKLFASAFPSRLAA